jgi:Spermidine/putrescine-binding periplasmic protein
MISRRKALRAGAGLAAIGALGAPAIAHAQTKTLKITTWGGKWGDIMKATVLPAFEKEFKCTVSADQAFPFMPKLQASPRTIRFTTSSTPTPTSSGAALTKGW